MRSSVVIIGGGIIGCGIALRLAQRGLEPLLLERSVPGAEASSAAAGILSPLQEAHGPGPGLDLGVRSRDLYPAFVRELQDATGVDVGYRRCGLISLANGDEAQLLERRASWLSAQGFVVQRLSPVEARSIEPGLGPHVAALRFPDEAQVEPPRLMRALQLAAVRAGVRFHHAYVRRVLHDGQRVRGVELEGEVIDTTRVVLAAGSWSGLIEGTLLAPRAVRPMRGQLLELETRPSPISHVVYSSGGYVVPRSDGRIVVGATMEEAGFRKEVTADGLASLLAVARAAVPELGSAQVLRFWANFRPATDDHLPILGAGPLAGLFLATGHFRNGILLAPITAESMAALICDEQPPVDLTPFSPARVSLAAPAEDEAAR